MEKYETRFAKLEQNDKEKTDLIAKLDDDIKGIKQDQIVVVSLKAESKHKQANSCLISDSASESQITSPVIVCNLRRDIRDSAISQLKPMLCITYSHRVSIIGRQGDGYFLDSTYKEKVNTSESDIKLAFDKSSELTLINLEQNGDSPDKPLTNQILEQELQQQISVTIRNNSSGMLYKDVMQDIDIFANDLSPVLAQTIVYSKHYRLYDFKNHLGNNKTNTSEINMSTKSQGFNSSGSDNVPKVEISVLPISKAPHESSRAYISKAWLGSQARIAGS
ncbi:hypothetical protein Glove_113g62 [Diversispora epigaea]|uniref:Uncharacterized protein n=1 Tax=Diversispora epigaea TaxID=1348612 RepID=A0A397J1J5_9GLOM|nr:hypothetical protein Glove_113g62 [Diversispora epigaea]